MQRQPSRAALDSGSRVTNCFSQDYAQTAQVAKDDVALVAAERLLWVRRVKGQPQRERRTRIWCLAVPAKAAVRNGGESLVLPDTLIEVDSRGFGLTASLTASPGDSVSHQETR
jgi:hypothetical protein